MATRNLTDGAVNRQTPPKPKPKRMPGPRPKPSTEASSLRSYRAGERASAEKPTGRSTATSVRRKAPGLTAPPQKGATVGSALGAGKRFLNEVNTNIQGALKLSPGLRSKGIENVMKLPPKKKPR